MTDNGEKSLNGLEKHLIKKSHQSTKCFQPKLNKSKDLGKSFFTRTFHPNRAINKKNPTRSLENMRSNEVA